MPKKYLSGESFIGQDKSNPLWIWELAGLDTEKPIIGVTNGDGAVYYSSGKLCLPENYICIKPNRNWYDKNKDKARVTISM